MSTFPLALRAAPLTLAALLLDQTDLRRATDGLPVQPGQPRHLLHGQLRRNATGWLAAQARCAVGLPQLLTATDMMEALGCGDRAFHRWRSAGLIPGGRVAWDAPWQCPTVTFVCWLGMDDSWFDPVEVRR